MHGILDLKTNVNIMKAAEEDIPHLTELFVQLGEEEKLSIEEDSQIWKKFGQYPNYSVYVAKYNDEIVGAFELLIMDNFAHKGTPSAVIEDVVVDSKFRSLGIGKAMMEFAMEICKQHGCLKLTLSSNFKREKAHQFYENLGFTKHGYSFYVHLNKKPL